MLKVQYERKEYVKGHVKIIGWTHVSRGTINDC